MFSCEEETPYMKVEKTVSKSTELVYQINTAGVIDGSLSISSRELVQALTDDKEFWGDRDDYTITELTIQSLAVTLLPKTGNMASGVNTTSFVSSDGTFSGKPRLLNEQPIGMGANNNVLVNTHLVFDGVDAINKFLKEAIGSKGLNKRLYVYISGNTVPFGGKAVADLKLNVTFNIEYWYCEQSVLPILLDIEERECN